MNRLPRPQWPKLSLKFPNLSMWQTFYIKPNEIGMLYHRSDFQKILRPGTYTYWGRHYSVQTDDLNYPQAKIENLELLLRTNAAELEQHLLVVRTAFNQAALVRLGQNWISVPPDRVLAFWRGFIEVEAHLFNLEDDLQLPTAFVPKIRRTASLSGVKKFQISEAQIGLLYVQNNFVRPLEPGEYAFWSFENEVQVQILNRTIPNPNFPLEEVLIENHPDFVANYCTAVELSSHSVAIVRDRGKAIAILPPCSRKLFWQGVEVEMIDISDNPKLPENLVAELVSSPETAALSSKALHLCQVNAQHVGLLYINQEFREQLPPGIHAWWVFGRSFHTETFDLRQQTLEVSGQDILSQDKVPLRVNLTAGYRIVNPLTARNTLTDMTQYLYKELQFALRGAVGEKSLDALLEDKGAIDRGISEYIRTKTRDYGIEIDSVGVKDIILPGEIRTILSKVVEAEKSAEANTIRRREETAATRSMLNTAKVMENNPVALRLKELEILERIADKIDKIQVNGSLDSILTELIQIERRI